METTFTTIFNRLVELAGSQTELARLTDNTPQNVYHWRTRGVPLNQVDIVERALGYRISFHEIRPDKFSPPPSAA